MNIFRRLFKPKVAKLERKGNMAGLVRAIQYPDPTVRYTSVCALLRLRATEALVQIGPLGVELVSQALEDPDKLTWQAAIATLGLLGDARAVGPLLAFLARRGGAEHQAVTQALVQMGEPATEPLIAGLNDANIHVRRAVANALGQTGDTRAVEPLIVALSDEDSGVRRAAAEALVQIGQPAVEPLIAALDDAGSCTRRGAARALGEIGDTRAVELLIRAFAGREKMVSQAAARALRHFSTPKARKALDDYDYVPIILYVEDNREGLFLVRSILESEGYHVVGACDGPSGLMMAAEIVPDVILSDINLPEIDGYDLVRRLKADERTAHIPVMAVTANVAQGDREWALAAGFDGYICKPIEVDRFPDQVRCLLIGQRWK